MMTPNMRRVAECESGLNPLAYNSKDEQSRGLMQISKYWWPDVSDECAFDPVCSIEWSFRQKPKLWSCAKILGITEW